jgi:hypothetical protein
VCREHESVVVVCPAALPLEVRREEAEGAGVWARRAS